MGGTLPRRLFQYLACSLVALLVLLLYYSRQLDGQPALLPRRQGPTASAGPVLQPQQEPVCQHQPVYPADIEVRKDNLSSFVLRFAIKEYETIYI
jgi:hypothetical protein